MAANILKITYAQAKSDLSGNYARAIILCDTAADLPSVNAFTNYELIQGSEAIVINENTKYMMDSGGNWYISGDTFTDVYTKQQIDTLLQAMQDDLTADENALAFVVDNGVKNILKFDKVGTSSANASTSYVTNGVTFTVNPDCSVSVSGTLTANASAYCYLYDGTNRTNIIEAFDGNHVIAGNPAGASISTYRLWYKVGSETAVAEPTNGTILPDKSSQSNAVIGLQINADASGWTGSVIFEPMLCAKSLWDVSQAYEPYAPSNRELYEMILALQ